MSEEDAIAGAEAMLRRERWPVIRKQLPIICDEIGSLCSNRFTYSLRYVAQRFGSSQKLTGVFGALDAVDGWATTIGQFFRVTEELPPSAKQLEVYFEMILGIMWNLRRYAVEPFVQLVREEGQADAAVLDGYVDFRRRWDDLVKRFEALGKQVGLDPRVSMHLAPELHVSLKA